METARMNHSAPPHGYSLEYAVLCESTSKEMSGKDVLVGAVPDGLMAPLFPLTFRCAFWCIVRADDALEGVHTLTLRLCEKGKPDAPDFAQFNIQFSTAQRATGRSAFNTLAEFVTIREPLTAILMWSIDGSNFVPLREIPFVKVPSQKTEK